MQNIKSDYCEGRNGVIMLDHDKVCEKAVDGVKNVDSNTVIAAWISSLSTRNLPARSAFGSYIVLQNFKEHDFHSSKIYRGKCAYCGLSANSNSGGSSERTENYPFQVQHTDIGYAAHDLFTFGERKVNNVTQNDIDCLKQILDSVRSLSASSQLSQLNKSLQTALKSNKHERTILLETLGYAGILCSVNQENYTNQFPTYEFVNSQQPKEHSKREWAYPIRFWAGLDGVNEAMVNHYFGSFFVKAAKG